jgi:hypothetical protein
MRGIAPIVPQSLDEAERWRRLDQQDFRKSRYWRFVFVGGWLVLALFGVLAFLGLPGSGLLLVPIGLGMIIGGGLQLVIER